MYKLGIEVKVSDTATPALAEVMRSFTGQKPDLMSRIAAGAEVLTRRHIAESAAPSRHRTAQRLGATPTGYLARRANAVESSHTGSTATVTLGGEAEIFARAFGDVTVNARPGKSLAIPWRAEAYGRRPREFTDLFPVKSKRGNAFLARRDGKTLQFVYLLKRSVLLPEDRGLLPSDEQYVQITEQAAVEFIEEKLTS